MVGEIVREERVDAKLWDEPDSTASRWSVWWIFLGLAVAVVGAAASQLPIRTESVVAQTTVRATHGSIERLVLATGTVEPRDEVEVRPRVSGIVQEVRVGEGDWVEKGTPLIRLDRDLIQLQVHEARSALEAASIQFEHAGWERVRVGALFQKSILARRAYENAETQRREAETSVARARARLSYLKKQLDFATVRAPIDGRILNVLVKPGAAVSSITSVTGGTPLLRIANTSLLHLDGLVDETEVGFVHVGQHVRLSSEAFPDRTFQGRVSAVDPSGERHQNVTYFRVEVGIDDPDSGLLRPKMSMEGDIIAEVISGAVLVPEVALHYEGEAIYVERPGSVGEAPQFERQQVRVGIIQRGRAQIVSGLVHGDEVVVQ